MKLLISMVCFFSLLYIDNNSWAKDKVKECVECQQNKVEAENIPMDAIIFELIKSTPEILNKNADLIYEVLTNVGKKIEIPDFNRANGSIKRTTKYEKDNIQCKKVEIIPATPEEKIITEYFCNKK